MIAFGQTGIGTLTPTTKLHVVGTPTLEPFRIEGLKAGTGVYLLVDPNGVMKTSTEISKQPFVFPTVSSTGPLILAKADDVGGNKYLENSAPTTPIKWSKIPGAQSTFTITKTTNTLSISAEGVTQYDGDLGSTGSTNAFLMSLYIFNSN